MGQFVFESLRARSIAGTSTERALFYCSLRNTKSINTFKQMENKTQG